MPNITVVTIPVYSEQDKSVLESVKNIAEELKPDFISISYYCDGIYKCLVLAFDFYNSGSAKILYANFRQWEEWKKANGNIRRYWRGEVPGIVEVYEVANSFEVGVERRLGEIGDFISATLWDTSREGNMN